MIIWLQTLSTPVVLSIVVFGVAALCTAAPLFGRHVLRLQGNNTRDDAAFDAFKVVMSLIGVLLAFALIEAVTNLRATETMVGREAAALAAVDRSLLRFGTAEAASMRPLLEEYEKSRVELEWPGLERSERNFTTDEKYNALSRRVRSLQPADNRQQALFSEVLRSLDELAETREMTVQNADLDLPSVFWIVAFGQLAVGIGLAALTTPTYARLISLATVGGSLALLFALLIIIDHPFGGDTGVKPTSLQRIMVVNSQRV